MDKVTANTAAHTFITSKVNYGNTSLCGLPATPLRKLQVVQNAAARVVARVKKYDTITNIRQEHQWLPIKATIAFKILLLTWKALLAWHVTKILRSATNYNLASQRQIIKRNGTFVKADPVLWNALCECMQSSGAIHIFKNKLKIHSFYYSKPGF